MERYRLLIGGQWVEGARSQVLREKFRDGGFMKRVVADVIDLLGEPADGEGADVNQLWDEKQGAVEGGRDWSAALEVLMREGHLVVSGPDLPEAQAPW